MIHNSNIVTLESARAGRESISAPSLNTFQGVSAEAPPCPQFLCPDAKRHWRYIVAELKKAALVTKLDQGSLVILCESFAGMKAAKQKLDEYGEYQITPNNYYQLSPWAVSFDRHASRYNKIAAQYGMTLRSRKQIDIKDPNQNELPL